MWDFLMVKCINILKEHTLLFGKQYKRSHFLLNLESRSSTSASFSFSLLQAQCRTLSIAVLRARGSETHNYIIQKMKVAS